MNALIFASRTRREILRDPLSAAFGIGFPVILILLISLMKQSIPEMPEGMYGVESFAPGMAVFGLSFLMLFLAMLMTNDGASAYLMRLFASPLTARDYIAGYALPLFPMALLQGIVCFGTAAFFGLQLNARLLLALLLLLPAAALFIGLGLLLGAVLRSPPQVGGIGSILINVAAWLSGTWFSLEMIGGAFRTVCRLLPFAHAVELVKAGVQGNYGDIPVHLLWVLGYAAVIFAAAVLLFRRRMKR